MVLRMKNFNILGVHWKIRLLIGGGGSQKTNIEAGDYLKRGRVWTVYWFKGELGKKGGGGVFEGEEGGGLRPQYTLCSFPIERQFNKYELHLP